MNDEYFMSVALVEVERAYEKGQLPIGAALVIGGNLIGVKGNSQVKHDDWFNHAENILIQENSKLIKKSVKDSEKIELYTTLEPCLMCFGAVVHNRLTRIIYSCPDPSAGSSHINPPTEWYAGKWPEIVRGPFCKESYDLFVKFMKENPESWSNVLPLYKKIEPNIL